MVRLPSIDTLAPEVRSSRAAGLMTAAALAFVVALAAAGLILSLVLQSREGTTQVVFHSIEPFGTAPGARLVFVPEKQTYVIRGWLFKTLGATGTYQAWAVDGGRYRSLGTADAVAFIGFALAGEGDLRGVDRIVITSERPGGSLAPQGPVVVELIPGL